MTVTLDLNLGTIVGAFISTLVGIIAWFLRKDFKNLTIIINKLGDSVTGLTLAQQAIAEKFNGHEKIADFKYQELNGRITKLEQRPDI